MMDSIWRIQYGEPKCEFDLNWVKLGTRGFSGSLIIILSSKIRNSKWRIEYGGLNMVNPIWRI